MKWPKLALRQVRWVAYGAAYLFVFVACAYVSFPYDRLRQHLVSMYNAAQTGAHPDRLEVDSLTWSWRFPGVVAEGVRLVVGAPPPPEGEKPPPPQYLEVDEVFVSASPLA